MNKKFVIISIILTVILGAVYGLYSSPTDADSGNNSPKVTINTKDNDLRADETRQENNDNANDNANEKDNVIKLLNSEPYAKTLVEEGTKNILIIGEDKENYLYDTIGIINIDKKNKKIKIIMIPRDMYMDYTEPVLKVIESEGKLNEPGYFKINNAHHIGVSMKFEGDFGPRAINFLHALILEKFNIDFEDYIKVDRFAIREFVDIFGGVSINVPYNMKYEDGYQDLYIHLDKGTQLLNGEQVEGFLRFRQGYDNEGNFIEYGDILRKENQINFIREFIKQKGTIANVLKIPQVLTMMGDNVRNSISIVELPAYVALCSDIVNDKYTIESTVLKGEFKMIRGSSYLVIN